LFNIFFFFVLFFLCCFDFVLYYFWLYFCFFLYFVSCFFFFSILCDFCSEWSHLVTLHRKKFGIFCVHHMIQNWFYLFIYRIRKYIPHTLGHQNMETHFLKAKYIIHWIFLLNLVGVRFSHFVSIINFYH